MGIRYDKARGVILGILSALCLIFAGAGCEPGAAPTSAPAAHTPTSAPATLEPAASTVPEEEEEGGQIVPFELTSTAFVQGEPIPGRYTCDGEDVSLPLQWGDPPAGTLSFAIIMDDPDAPVGTWIHWVLYNLPDEIRALPEAVPPDTELPDGSRHGENSWRRPGYGGPCPPSGTHRYFFKLYALDAVLDLAAGASKEQLLQVMEGHILAQAELMGTYTR